MFYIGAWDKQKIITHYLEHNPSVNGVVVFYREGLQREYDIPVKCEYLEYKQSIKYTNYYRLLEHVNRNTLIIVDECLGTSNCHCLEYNCMKTILNQTPQRLVFNYLPFIDSVDDFMILMEFYNDVRYKGEAFDWNFLKDINLHVKPVHVKIEFERMDLPEKSIEKYTREREKLFNNAVNDVEINPDTIHRQLALLAGNLRFNSLPEEKRGLINDCLVRNNRFKMGVTYKDCMKTYPECDEIKVFDFPTYKKHLLDVLNVLKVDKIHVFTSDLRVDDLYYRQTWEKWVNELEEFYQKFAEIKNAN